ncbi:S-layer homology domain-containing protein [Solibacillus sp. CAU 1738]|uniref:S-layer homology domain-containing protein n=1 Tax=Solibacillus sp. CAU 1738 TaxID=3140363 RepID=UPI0032614827
MKRFKIFAILLLALQLVLPMSAFAEENDELINYLALGDSLAAGIQDNGELGPSYADFFASSLAEDELLGKFNKGFAYPGYTTTDVLNDLKNDIQKPVVNSSGTQSETVALRDSIAKADIITISAGANDVLKYFKTKEDGTAEIDLAGISKGIQEVGANYNKILTEIEKINPDALVMIMGYYNPYPYADESLQKQLNELVYAMDKVVAQVALEKSAIFVPVAEEIALDYKLYLPNPKNIHLSKDGYKLVGSLFTYDLWEYLLDDSLYEEIYFTDTEGHWAKEYIDFAAMFGLMNGYEDGTFKPDQALKRVQMVSILARMIGLEPVGEAPFKDISGYADATKQEIAAAYHADLVQGYGELLKPEDKVTRAQMALMISRAYTLLTGAPYIPTTVAPFTDIDSYNVETQYAITLLYDYEIAQGVGNNKFAPKQVVTRAQAAKILTGFMMTLTTEE